MWHGRLDSILGSHLIPGGGGGGRIWRISTTANKCGRLYSFWFKDAYLPEYGMVDVAATVESQLRLQAYHLQRIICNKETASWDYSGQQQEDYASTNVESQQ